MGKAETREGWWQPLGGGNSWLGAASGLSKAGTILSILIWVPSSASLSGYHPSASLSGYHPQHLCRPQTGSLASIGCLKQVLNDAELTNKVLFHLRSWCHFVLTAIIPSFNQGWRFLLDDHSWTTAWCCPVWGTQAPFFPQKTSPLWAGQVAVCRAWLFH